MPAKTKPEVGMLAKLEDAAKTLNLNIKAEQLNGQGKTFEAWALLEIAFRLQGLPRVHIEAVGYDNNPVGTFNFRGAPGHIPPVTASGSQPSHFRIRHDDGAWFELHLALEHLGESGTTHELDISVVSADDADMIRAGSGGAYIGFRAAAVELKAYDAKIKLPKSIPRALIGAAVDLDIGILIQDFSFSTRSHIYHGYSPRAPQHWLLTTTTIADPSKTYLDAYGIGHDSSVGPSHDSIFDTIAQDIVRRLW